VVLACRLVASVSPVLSDATGEGAWLTRHWAWLALGTVLLLLIIAFSIFTRYLRISLRLFMDTRMPMTAGLGNGLRLESEPHPFPSRDGTGLVGAFVDPPPGVAVRGIVVFAPEFDGDRHSAMNYTAGLPELGFRIFSFDFRGHGESSNDPSYRPTHWVTEHEVDDLLAAVAYAGSLPENRGLPIVLMGVSRGACAAVLATIHAPHVSALVLDGVFSTDLMVEGMMKRWAVIFASIHLARPSHPPEVFAILRVMTVLYAELKMRVRYPLVRKALTRLGDVPMLFIWGEADAYVDPYQRIKVYRAKSGVKQMWEVPGAKHNQGVVANPQGYRERIAAFLDARVRGSVRTGSEEVGDHGP
jgi:pimeloyl-ACP methyl ester carboxylesterase